MQDQEALSQRAHCVAVLSPQGQRWARAQRQLRASEMRLIMKMQLTFLAFYVYRDNYKPAKGSGMEGARENATYSTTLE